MIVLGTLLNDIGEFYDSCRMSLRRELFSNKRNAFVYGIIEDMHRNGRSETFPINVFNYANEYGIKYGNMTNFCVYMCELSMNYAFKNFKKYVKELVGFYLREVRYEAR